MASVSQMFQMILICFLFFCFLMKERKLNYNCPFFLESNLAIIKFYFSIFREFFFRFIFFDFYCYCSFCRILFCIFLKFRVEFTPGRIAMFVYKFMLEKISFLHVSLGLELYHKLFFFLWWSNFLEYFFSNNSNFRLGDLLLEILCAIFKNFCFEIGGQ